VFRRSTSPEKYINRADLELIRVRQCASRDGTKIVGVSSRRDGESRRFHLKIRGDNVPSGGHLASDRRNTIVNILGLIDLEKFASSRGNSASRNSIWEKRQHQTAQ